jgi:hypothetical protein
MKSALSFASWASDACAVEAAPDLRAAPSGRVVRFDEIIEALRALDKQGNGATYRRVLRRQRILGGKDAVTLQPVVQLCNERPDKRRPRSLAHFAASEVSRDRRAFCVTTSGGLERVGRAKSDFHGTCPPAATNMLGAWMGKKGRPPLLAVFHSAPSDWGD